VETFFIFYNFILHYRELSRIPDTSAPVAFLFPVRAPHMVEKWGGATVFLTRGVDMEMN
jgi:hypothetical protein